MRSAPAALPAAVCESLRATRDCVEAAEAAWRQAFLPPPSREHPRPEPAALHGAQTLEALGRELGLLESRVRNLPPTADRHPVGLGPVEAEQAMLEHAEFLRSLLAPADAGWMIKAEAEIRRCIAAVERALQARCDPLAL